MSLPPALPSTGHRRRPWSARLLLAVGLAMAAGLGVLAFRFSQPRWYYAQTVIGNGSLSFEDEANPPRLPPAERAAADLEALREPELLDRVVKMLDLTQVYARGGARRTPEDARETLRQALRIEVGAREPALAFIGVYDRDPAMAASLANTVTFVYREHRREAWQPVLEHALSQRSAEIEQRRAQVRAAAGELQKVRARDQLTDPDPERTDSAVTGRNTGAYLTAKRDYVVAKGFLVHAGHELAELRIALQIRDSPVRLRQKAEPPTEPVPWWRGDPRPRREITII